jgi:hypothetical protein
MMRWQSWCLEDMKSTAETHGRSSVEVFIVCVSTLNLGYDSVGSNSMQPTGTECARHYSRFGEFAGISSCVQTVGLTAKPLEHRSETPKLDFVNFAADLTLDVKKYS